MCCATSCCAPPPNLSAGLTLKQPGRARPYRRLGQPPARLAGRAGPHPVRSRHQVGRRLSRRLVRERPRQGDVRLRRGGRKFRQSLHARHRLCAAPSCVRRGQRQEAHLGPCGRRHGRDHPGDGARRPRPMASRSRPTRRCARSWWSATACAASLWRTAASFAARAVAANVDPLRLYTRLMPSGALSPEFLARIRRWRCGSGTFRMNLALSRLPSFTDVPAERGAGSSHVRDHHGAEPGLHGARLPRRAPARLEPRADHRDADSLHAGRFAGARRAPMWRAFFASTSRRNCLTASRGTTIATPWPT